MDFKSRQKEKAESRQKDSIRLESGENPEVIQKENSIFPEGFFENCKIQNLKDAIGK